MSHSRRTALGLTLALSIIWVALAIVAYDRLPDTVAMHFGLNGEADGFTQRSWFSWFGFTAIGLATTALLLGLAHFSHDKPSMYNIPNKEKLLALSKDDQAPIVEELAMWMTYMALSMVVLFASLQYDMWRVATTGQTGLSLVSGFALGLTTVGSLVMVFFVFRIGNKIDAVVTAADANRVPRRRAS